LDDNINNIDSKAFDVTKFVTQHLQSSSVQTILEIEEQLSLQVKTYDSTMQTLVYENYTKFIDVTNAIKSIGTTVTSTNEEQIQQLITYTNSIYHTSRMMTTTTMMEESSSSHHPNHPNNDGHHHIGDIGMIRQQVVEKKRIQRLLQRLHSLFVLPQTIRQYIQQQQYTIAITKYIQASSILAKYNRSNNNNNDSNNSNSETEDHRQSATSITKLESFTSITTECIMLLQQLQIQLQNQFYYWSGRSSELVVSTNSNSYNDTIVRMSEEQKDHIVHFQRDNDDDPNNNDDDDVPTQELPKSMMEIYESVRALSMLYDIFQEEHPSNMIIGTSDDATSIDTKRRWNDNRCRVMMMVEQPEELYSMSFSAATRLLDRILDAHSIQVQEHKFMMMNNNNHQNSSMNALDDHNNDHSSSNHNSTGSILGILSEPKNDGTTTTTNTTTTTEHENYLIPQNVLIAILDCATLYQSSFQHMKKDQDWWSERKYYLMEFITESYTTFISHVRSILLQEDSIAGDTSNTNRHLHDQDPTIGLESDHGIVASHPPTQEIAPEEISQALTVLVQYVQLFTNRLVDEVHLNVEYTNHLMQQAIDLASSLVHRRVDNQFRTLRYSIVNECLLPFTNRIVEDRERILQEKSSNMSEDDNFITNNVLPEIIQIASSTLSDCLQLIDDTIRSIITDNAPSTTEDMDGSNNNGNVNQTGTVLPSDVQDALQTNTYRLVSWLANAFEIMAGGDTTDYNHMAQAPKSCRDENGNEAVNASHETVVYECIGDGCEDEVLALLYKARENIYQGYDGTLHSDIMLSMIELCRLSETMVTHQIEQSLHFGSSGSGGVGKKKSLSSQRDLFPSSHGETTKSTSSMTLTTRKNGSYNSNVPISQRYQVAGSRIFTILVMDTAHDAIHRLLSNTVTAISDHRGPSDNVLAVVKLAKTLSLQCATLFGGTKRAGPIPIWDESNFISTTTMSMLSNRKSGLYLDVERMFKEKVTIYPHPSDILEYSRDSAIFLYFKIVLRSWYESIVEYATATFSLDEYLQMQVDTVFIKHIIPHYLSNEYHDTGTNGRAALATLMGDVLEAVEHRYHHQTMDNDPTYGSHHVEEEIQRKARTLVRSFMVLVESDTKLSETFIIQES
jgi:hypothetical protein